MTYSHPNTEMASCQFTLVSYKPQWFSVIGIFSDVAKKWRENDRKFAFDIRKRKENILYLEDCCNWILNKIACNL